MAGYTMLFIVLVWQSNAFLGCSYNGLYRKQAFVKRLFNS